MALFYSDQGLSGACIRGIGFPQPLLTNSHHSAALLESRPSPGWGFPPRQKTSQCPVLPTHHQICLNSGSNTDVNSLVCMLLSDLYFGVRKLVINTTNANQFRRCDNRCPK